MKLKLIEKQKFEDQFTRSEQLKRSFSQALDWFNRKIRLFIQPGKVDSTNVRQVTEATVKEFMVRMNMNAEEAFSQILEDGMARAGIRLTEKRIDPMIVRVLYHDSPIWTAYRGMNDSLIKETNRVISQHLVREGGISYTRLVSELQTATDMADKRAKVIARTETNVVNNKGREIGYRMKDPQNRWRYTWGGPYDKRTSETCNWIKDQVPPGGLSLDELKRLVGTATLRFHPKLTPRDWSAHPNCRHFPVKLTRAEVEMYA